MKQQTIIVPIIRADFISRFLDTLAAYTKDYYVFVIDQTEDNLAFNEHHKNAHLWIKAYRNLGFSKAMNIGIKLAETPYITLANDDLEFMHPTWFDGILQTFDMDHHIIAVNPMSPKEGAWGYGLRSDNFDTWTPPEGFIRDTTDMESVLPEIRINVPFGYKKEFSDNDYNWLKDYHPRWKKDTLNDAIAMWCTTFKRSAFDKIGLMEEKFYPGGGEDYDMNARAYSCAWPYERDVCDPEYHYRMVATTKSWVWHHWGKSKELSAKNAQSAFFQPELRWNNNDELWPYGFDVWGHKTDESGVKRPMKRNPVVSTVEL